MGLYRGSIFLDPPRGLGTRKNGRNNNDSESDSNGNSDGKSTT